MQSLSESFYIAAALIVSGDEGLWAIVLLSLKVSLSAVIIAGAVSDEGFRRFVLRRRAGSP